MNAYPVVYQLKHKRKVEFVNNEWVYDSKLIGYYSTKEKALETIEKYKSIKGFCDYPDDFYITNIPLDFDDYDFI